MNIMERAGDRFLLFPYDHTLVHETLYGWFSEEGSTGRITGTYFRLVADF
jgi:hypothetical protein